MKVGFLEESEGVKSNSRLMADIAIVVALLFAGMLIWIGSRADKPDIMAIAGAAGLIFITIAGPAMTFIFLQKKEEGRQAVEKQNLIAKIENPDNKNLINTPTT